MILIADGGSTKADWVALAPDGTELFRTRTQGINPEILREELLMERLLQNELLIQSKNEVNKVFFYGAGCGTEKAKLFLKSVFEKFFTQAVVVVKEDMLAAVYAASGGKESIVCILGTGSNSCYFDGKEMFQICPSLGYMIMDEASANLFGRRLIRDYFYKQMPEEIYVDFGKKFNLDADVVKENIYKKEAPNSYLGEFSTIMFDHKESKYIQELLKEGFREFYKFRVKTFTQYKKVPVFFIGSIAYYFQDLLKEVALEFETQFGGSVQRPIDNLISYHQKML
jgi:N-acetylglucosamine kinase-like BadF-type ATPase